MEIHETANSIERNPRILVADDYEVNQKVAQLILQKAGYHVDIVENGQQALEACRQSHYDLILMDIQMPHMDGYEATKRIRKWEDGIRKAEGGSGNESGTKSDLNSEIPPGLNALRVGGQNPKSEFETHESSCRHGEHSDGSSIQELNEKIPHKNSEFRIPTSDFKRVPIIAMTGNAGEGIFNEEQYPGMNDCIGKPMQRDLLLSVVQKWINAESESGIHDNPPDGSRLHSAKPETNQFPLNLDQALQEFLGKKEILYGVLHEFIVKAKIRIDTILQAVKGLDYGAIVSEAHGIKGGAANLRADKLASLAADLENAGEARQPDLIAELADKLEQEFYNLEQYIRQHPEI